VAMVAMFQPRALLILKLISIGIRPDHLNLHHHRNLLTRSTRVKFRRVHDLAP